MMDDDGQDNNLVIRRLKWRSRRSMLEVDLYLDRFIFLGGLEKLTADELASYTLLLELSDWDFLALLHGSQRCNDIVMQNVIKKINNINI